MTKLIKELQQLTEAKADVGKAIAYMSHLGIKVDPIPMKNIEGEITFKVLDRTPKECFHYLDSISEDEDNPTKDFKLYAGQGFGNGGGLWYDKTDRNMVKTIELKKISNTECEISLSHDYEEESRTAEYLERKVHAMLDDMLDTRGVSSWLKQAVQQTKAWVTSADSMDIAEKLIGNELNNYRVEDILPHVKSWKLKKKI